MLTKLLLLLLFLKKIFSNDFDLKINEKLIKNDNICRCSGPLYKSRIINGTTVIGYDYSWTVAIYSKRLDNIFCTGSLISASTVLTAAHCFDEFTIDDVYVLAGFIYDWNKMKNTDWGSRKVSSIIIHENYSPEIQNYPLKNDIAIIKLEKEFELGFNNDIYLACILENEIKNPEKLDYYFAGYGLIKPYYLDIKNNKTLSKLVFSKGLNHIKLNYNQNLCNQNNSEEFTFCLNNKDGSLCNIDSGGPFHIFINKKLAIVSILSSSVYQKDSFYNETVILECYKGNDNYGIKLFNHLDFIKKEGNPKCLLDQNNFK